MVLGWLRTVGSWIRGRRNSFLYCSRRRPGHIRLYGGLHFQNRVTPSVWQRELVNTFVWKEILRKQKKWFLEMQLSICARYVTHFVLPFPGLVHSSRPFQVVWKCGPVVDVLKVIFWWDYCYFEGGNCKICECTMILLCLPKIVSLAKPLHCLLSCLEKRQDFPAWTWLPLQMPSLQPAVSVCKAFRVTFRLFSWTNSPSVALGVLEYHMQVSEGLVCVLKYSWHMLLPVQQVFWNLFAFWIILFMILKLNDSSQVNDFLISIVYVFFFEFLTSKQVLLNDNASCVSKKWM